tara:strand:- start:107 stop:826 length:720 start_codon:yes stop_codon:yes gene_type:complete
MLDNLRRIYSPNFVTQKRDARKIKFIILHYTGMQKEKNAINRLTNINSKVSCHYLITNSGEVINLVPDLYISWHAGKSKWKKIKSLNSSSLGIEISNPGHQNGYCNYKKKQIKSLISLITILKKKYKIRNNNILGHSDIAPDRKKDPGEKFPWKLMYNKKLSIWHDIDEKKLKRSRGQKCNNLEVHKFINNLKIIGYKSKKNISMIKAFQRRFRPKLISGKIDKECLFISISLIKNNKD